MTDHYLVTIVGATGAQGGAVVRALLETGKYKIRGLTRDATSDKAKVLQLLDDKIEVMTCDIRNSDDVQRAFNGSWAVFAMTDFWAQPDQPELEIQQGIIMADVAASLKVPYFIFSTLENVFELSNKQLDVPDFTNKATIRHYIQDKHPNLKAIFVQPAYYMQNWQSFDQMPKLEDGTVVFASPMHQKTKLHIFDIDDLGVVIREVLREPEKYVGKDICICAEAMTLEEMAKVFTKVTNVPAISKTLTEEECRLQWSQVSPSTQTRLLNMYRWFEEYGYYGKDKDWSTGKQLTSLNTFEQWLKKSGWRGDGK